jgi:hypothetical protein
MQSSIILAIMTVISLFTGAEYMRNNSTEANVYQPFKAKNVADNVLQYSDLMLLYMLDNFDTLHQTQAVTPGNVEQITAIDYNQNQISGYSLKNLILFLNYSSIAFNYTKSSVGESQPIPVLYIATSWDSFSNSVHGYSSIQMPEVMGQLGQDVSKHVYQGNSTFWVIPWIFSQSNCNVKELYSQLPNDSTGASAFNKLKTVFNLFCTQIQANSSYRFSTYVYIEPVINSSDS